MTNKLCLFLFVFLFLAQSVVVWAEAPMDAAQKRFRQITSDSNSMKPYSDSHTIMYKKIHGKGAYLSKFKYITGVAQRTKVALLYKVFNSKSKSQ